MNYQIFPIPLFKALRDRSIYTYRENYGILSPVVNYVWYIAGARTKILVDAGVSLPAFQKRGASGEQVATLVDGLNSIGIEPNDIGLVIMTHLHWDHTCLGHLFKNARFLVQKKELEYSSNPHSIDKHHYDSQTLMLNWEVIDGEKNVFDGISVFLTPGHSPGGQSIEIKTINGTAIIPGFCCTFDTFNQTERMKKLGWVVSIPLIHQDIRETYESVLKVKRRADIILPLHDPAFLETKQIP